MNKFINHINVEYIKLYPAEAAIFLEQMSEEDTYRVFSQLPANIAATLVSNINLNYSLYWLNQLSVDKLGHVLELLNNDLCAIIFRRLPKNLQTNTLKCLHSKKQEALTRGLHYPRQHIGSITDPLVLTVSEEHPVQYALDIIKNATLYQHDLLYVVNRSQKLVGLLSLKEFISAHEQQIIKEVMAKPSLVLSADANINKNIENILRNEHNEIPVIDQNQHLVGVIRKSIVLQMQLNSPQPTNEQPSILLSFAELFWQITSGLLPGLHSKGYQQGNKNE